MTARPPSVLRGALSLLSVRLVLQQIGLALLVFLLYVLWLHVPDACVSQASRARRGRFCAEPSCCSRA
jgi:hypothetical protein